MPVGNHPQQLFGKNNLTAGYDEKLPLKLGLCLLGITIISLLIFIAVFIYNKFRKYYETKELVDTADEENVFDYLNIQHFQLNGCKSASPEPRLKTVASQPQLEDIPVFAIEDECLNQECELPPSSLVSNSSTESPSTLYLQLSLVKATSEFEQLPIRDKESDFVDNNKSQDLNEEVNIDFASSSICEPNAIRLVASMPNLRNCDKWYNPEDFCTLIKTHRTFLENTSCFDDSSLFKQNLDGDQSSFEYSKNQLLTGNEEYLTKLNSAGEKDSDTPATTIQLPVWATELGKPERPFIIFIVTLGSMEPTQLLTNNQYYLSVQILNACNVLSRSTEPKPGAFYIKARLQPVGTLNLGSLCSLDGVPNKSVTHVPDRISLLPWFKSHTSSATGRTPIRKAFRLLAFKHTIKLPVPSNLNEILTNLNSPTYETSNFPKYELRLDLKERLKSNEQNVSLWKHSRLVGSVRIILAEKLWIRLLDHESENLIHVRRSTVIPTDKERPRNRDSKSSITKTTLPVAKSSKILRFVRSLHIPFEDSEYHGELTFGMQYLPESRKICINPLKCSAMNLPKGTRNLYLRISLCTNHELIQTVQSRSTSRISLNAAEFVLGEKLEFADIKNLNQVCLIIQLFARCDKRLHESVILLGRCITGPSDLAMGDGLAHWIAMYTNRGMIRRTHLLI